MILQVMLAAAAPTTGLLILMKLAVDPMTAATTGRLIDAHDAGLPTCRPTYLASLADVLPRLVSLASFIYHT